MQCPDGKVCYAIVKWMIDCYIWYGDDCRAPCSFENCKQEVLPYYSSCTIYQCNTPTPPTPTPPPPTPQPSPIPPEVHSNIAGIIFGILIPLLGILGFAIFCYKKRMSENC